MPSERQPIVIANWKMYLGSAEGIRAARVIRALVSRAAGRVVEVVVCPSFPLLSAVREEFKNSRVQVGAQDAHAEAAGPYTGDVSVTNLRGLVRYVIVGHSERRQFHGETDETVGRKLRQVLHAGLRPVVCVGETAEERDRGETVAKVHRQVQALVSTIPALSLTRCVFAYEPIWAISAGPDRPQEQPDPADAAEVIGLIRKVSADVAGRRYAELLRIVYGGSVTAKSVTAFVSEPGVDGVLVGGASTKPAELAAIVREVRTCHS